MQVTCMFVCYFSVHIYRVLRTLENLENLEFLWNFGLAPGKRGKPGILMEFFSFLPPNFFFYHFRTLDVGIVLELSKFGAFFEANFLQPW